LKILKSMDSIKRVVVDVSRTTIRNPQPDTFRRVFENQPKEFEQCFRQWVQSLVEKLGVEVAIDGKAHRGSYDRASQLKALHMVSAWSSEHVWSWDKRRSALNQMKSPRFPHC